jgi:rhodanese-related sulfurtransferase
MNQITPAALAAKLASPRPPCLLDVRELEEHAIAALPDSKLIPLGELAGRMDELESWRDQEIVVYCHHGIRSMHAISLLSRAGFRQLLNLTGGIDRWSAEVAPDLPMY